MSEPTFTSEQLLDRATSMRECVRNAAPWGDTAAMLEFAARLVERRENLQRELLDLITLMPDSQTQEIVDYILKLRQIRQQEPRP